MTSKDVVKMLKKKPWLLNRRRKLKCPNSTWRHHHLQCQCLSRRCQWCSIHWCSSGSDPQQWRCRPPCDRPNTPTAGFSIRLIVFTPHWVSSVLSHGIHSLIWLSAGRTLAAGSWLQLVGHGRRLSCCCLSAGDFSSVVSVQPVQTLGLHGLSTVCTDSGQQPHR